MARPLRIEFAGALYHVMARGNARAAIFLDDADREAFCAGLKHTCERFDWRVWAWCLMGNHYHLLVETRTPSLARGMRQINGVYTQAFNRRHGRLGHVLQGRYKAVLVDQDNYLRELSRYVVLNPVKAQLCATAGDWPWSSYRAVMGAATAPEYLAVNETLALFSADRATAQAAYARFVAEGVDAVTPQTTQQIFFGDEAFVARMMAHVAAPSAEVPRRQRAPKALSQYHSDAPSRDEAIRAAWASGAYTLKEIAAHFDLHYATVSRIARRGMWQNKT